VVADAERGGGTSHTPAGPRGGGHACPWCLTRVPPAAARPRAHREACPSGELEVLLLCCPLCGLVLAAAVGPGAGPAGGGAR
jgi:hypothetical protein